MEPNNIQERSLESFYYSRTVNPDGKIFEVSSSYKRINDDWFVWNPEGNWESSTKELALEGSHSSTVFLN